MQVGDPDETPSTTLIRQLAQLSPRLGHRFVADPAKAAVFDAAAARVQAQADAVIGGTRRVAAAAASPAQPAPDTPARPRSVRRLDDPRVQVPD